MQATQPTQEKKTSLEKWQEDGKSSTVLIRVFHIAWTLFVQVTQCTSGTNNKALSTTLEKIKTDRLKIGRSFTFPLLSQRASTHLVHI